MSILRNLANGSWDPGFTSPCSSLTLTVAILGVGGGGQFRSDFIYSSLGCKQTYLRVAFLCSCGAGGHSLSSHRTQKRLLVTVDRDFLSVFSQEARCPAMGRRDSHCPSKQCKHDVLACTWRARVLWPLVKRLTHSVQLIFRTEVILTF